MYVVLSLLLPVSNGICLQARDCFLAPFSLFLIRTCLSDHHVPCETVFVRLGDDTGRCWITFKNHFLCTRSECFLKNAMLIWVGHKNLIILRQCRQACVTMVSFFTRGSTGQMQAWNDSPSKKRRSFLQHLPVGSPESLCVGHQDAVACCAGRRWQMIMMTLSRQYIHYIQQRLYEAPIDLLR